MSLGQSCPRCPPPPSVKGMGSSHPRSYGTPAYSTIFGRFRWLRMTFRISSAHEEFQRRINNTFENLKRTAIIADDLLVFGEDGDIESATKDDWKILYKGARERNFKLNKEKVKLRMTEVP